MKERLVNWMQAAGRWTLVSLVTSLLVVIV